MNIIGKTVSLNYGIYKIIKSISRDERYISLINLSNRKILRHQNSIVEERHIIDDKQFIEDSSFNPVVYDNKISFFATEEGIQEYCICYTNGILKITHITSIDCKNYQFNIDTKANTENIKYDGSKIFVAYHYDTSRFRNEIIEPIHVGRAIAKDNIKGLLSDIIGDDSGDNLSCLNKNFCELTAHYWMWKNTNYNIIGLMHYRRIFNLKEDTNNPVFKYFDKKTIEKFGLNIDNLNAIMSKYDIMVPEIYNTHPAGFPNELMTNYDFYASEHIKEHWDIMESIIKKYYPEYIPALVFYKNFKRSFFFNMFIMKRKYFNQYSNFMFDVIFKLKEATSLDKLDNYQKRLFGFISERLLNIYIIHLKFFSNAKIIHRQIIQKDEAKYIIYKRQDIITKPNTYTRKKSDPIYIAFSCDNKYVKHCYTAINSLKINSNYDLHIYILTSNIDSNGINFIKQLEGANCKLIEFINIDVDKFSIFPLNRNHISVATYYRLLLSKILPIYVEKIIYLDCDILVLGEIAELWEVDFPESHYALVIEDEGGATQSQRLGLPIEKKYFNAGVMVFNLKRLRKENMLYKSKAIYMKYKNKIRLQDQDILNIYFCGNVTYAPLNWNVGTRLYQKNDLKVTFSKDEWRDAILYPKIIHFTGNIKPWFLKCTHPLVNLYIQYQHPKFRKLTSRFLYNIKNNINTILNKIQHKG